MEEVREEGEWDGKGRRSPLPVAPWFDKLTKFIKRK